MHPHERLASTLPANTPRAACVVACRRGVHAHALALFGAPEDIAAEHTLLAPARKLMASWIACAEAVLRRLLLIEASAFPKPNTRPLLHAKRQRVRKAIGFDADKPEAWRVSFRCFNALRLSSPASGGGGREAIGGGAAAQSSDAFTSHRPLSHASRDSSPARGGAKRFYSAWPLAERYEALLRVFTNPEPYARRLARHLHATPHRARELLRAPKDAEHRVDLYDELSESAEAATRRAFNSS